MLYTGRSEDGSDMRPTGFFISPDGNEWSSEPYTTEQKEARKLEVIYDSIIDYLRNKSGENKNFNRQLRKEYQLILEKKSGLNRKQREFLIEYFKEEI